MAWLKLRHLIELILPMDIFMAGCPLLTIILTKPTFLILLKTTFVSMRLKVNLTNANSNGLSKSILKIVKKQKQLAKECRKLGANTQLGFLKIWKKLS